MAGNRAEYYPTNRGFDESLTWYDNPLYTQPLYMDGEFVIDDDFDHGLSRAASWAEVWPFTICSTSAVRRFAVHG
jgi:hypothetical protein